MRGGDSPAHPLAALEPHDVAVVTVDARSRKRGADGLDFVRVIGEDG